MSGRRETIAIFILYIFSISSVGFVTSFGLCMPEHPQAAVCRASFVVKAKVISTDWEADLARQNTVAPTTVVVTEPATEPPVTEATTEAPTTKAPTQATTAEVITEASTTEAATQEPTTEAPTTAAATEAPTTEAPTTRATTGAPPIEVITKAPTEAPTTVEVTQAPPLLSELAATDATNEAPTTAASLEPINEITENGNGKKSDGSSDSKIKAKPEDGEKQTDAEPIMKAAMIGQSAYFLKPKKIRVQLRKLYKGLRLIKSKVGEQINITFSSPHRTHLEVGETYLLTGFSFQNTLLMNECNWHTEWEKLTSTQKLGLRRYYWLFCRCNIRFCPGGSCSHNPRVCTWVVPLSLIDGKKADLLSSYSVCMVKCGRCGWHNPKEPIDCSIPPL